MTTDNAQLTAEPFQPPAMTPEEFHGHLRALINRMKGEAEWKQLAFFTRYQVGNLDDDFARMMEPIIGKDLRK